MMPLEHLLQTLRHEARGRALTQPTKRLRFADDVQVPHYSTLCYAEKRPLKKGLWTICSPPYSRVPTGSVS